MVAELPNSQGNVGAGDRSQVRPSLQRIVSLPPPPEDLGFMDMASESELRNLQEVVERLDNEEAIDEV
jgi:hypothetical protein